MPASLEIENLSKSFGCINAVDNVNLQIYPSQIVALLGPNGAGKSTLMNMIAGFLVPSEGKIKVLGKDNNIDVLEAKRNIGFLPEGSPLYGDMTVGGFLKYIAEIKGVEAKNVEKAIMLSSLKEVKEQKIETLSKGYRRRVGFAVSVLANPPILLLDEPTDGLDPNQKEQILGLIAEMSKDKTIIISTHLLEEAELIANRILIMDKGKIKADGDLESIKKQTRTTSLENAFIKLTR